MEEKDYYNEGIAYDHMQEESQLLPSKHHPKTNWIVWIELLFILFILSVISFFISNRD